MKLLDIVYDLKLIISRGTIPDDSKFDNRLLINWINNQRALWLTNEYNKKRDVRNNEVQVIKEIEFEVIDGNEFGIVDTGTKLMRSKLRIPRVLQIQTRIMLTSVRALNVVGCRLNLVNREQFVYSGNGKFNKGMLFVTLHNDYLYIKYGVSAYRDRIPTKLRGEGVFEDPLEIDVFNNTPDNIYDGIDEYPISRKFIDYMKAEILKLDIGSFYQAPLDDANDDENKPSR